MSVLPPKADIDIPVKDHLALLASLFFLNFRNVGSALRIGYAYSGQMEMNADPKRKPHQRDHRILTERARRDQEGALDDALKNTFPASDPVSIEQPAPPDADHD